jgi:D-alanine--poly(phosphoribitol) ligase subunit 2
LEFQPSLLEQSVLDNDTSGQQELISQIRALLLEKLSIRVQSPDVDLFETGALDSVAMVRLLFQLEEQFGLYLPMEDLGVDSFRTLSRIAETVDSRKGMNGHARSDIADPTGIPKPPDLAAEIQSLFLDKMSIRVESPDEDLFQSGIFDSMTLVEFILHLEERFSLHFPMEELELDSILSVNKIAEMVATQQATQQDATTAEVA